MNLSQKQKEPHNQEQRLPRGLGIVVVLMAWIVTGFVLSLPVQAATYTVEMGVDGGHLVFEPASLTVRPGDTVRWKNNALPPHNVVFDGHQVPAAALNLVGELSHSKLMLKPDETYELEITEDLAPGDYTYFCAPHRSAGMVGKLIIAS